MEDNFERGKQLIIEGFEEFIKLYFPYLKVIEGLRLLGLSDILSPAKADEDTLIRVGLGSLMSGLKDAGNREEVRKVIKQNEEFFKLVKGNGETQDS